MKAISAALSPQRASNLRASASISPAGIKRGRIDPSQITHTSEPQNGAVHTTTMTHHRTSLLSTAKDPRLSDFKIICISDYLKTPHHQRRGGVVKISRITTAQGTDRPTGREAGSRWPNAGPVGREVGGISVLRGAARKRPAPG